MVSSINSVCETIESQSILTPPETLPHLRIDFGFSDTRRIPR
ncbi:hypothetical protein ANCCAN_07419 [Ancylostoma caninum]|uniref:Uncharacterized protein n=1 Tax=Ancylostoma caninum TaxID=29170 RepID=A0A368GTD7_ANCCA|nr:hypothetical protein ANCCAN_07419 [Ancylostoma caninum]